MTIVISYNRYLTTMTRHRIHSNYYYYYESESNWNWMRTWKWMMNNFIKFHSMNIYTLTYKLIHTQTHTGCANAFCMYIISYYSIYINRNYVFIHLSYHSIFHFISLYFNMISFILFPPLLLCNRKKIICCFID